MIACGVGAEERPPGRTIFDVGAVDQLLAPWSEPAFRVWWQVSEGERLIVVSPDDASRGWLDDPWFERIAAEEGAELGSFDGALSCVALDGGAGVIAFDFVDEERVVASRFDAE
jgi:hypothetical protein